MKKNYSMFKLRKISILLLILIHFNSFSQNKVLIPFRIGDKFGLSDVDGKLVFPAEYDYFSSEKIGSYEASLEGFKEGTSTLFYKGNKIVELNKNTKYEVIRESFITATDENKAFDVFNIKGEKISNKKYIEMSFCDNILQRNFYYPCKPIIFKDETNKFSLLVFDPKTERFTKTIIENVYSVELVTKDYLYENLFSFYVKENINSKPVLLHFVFQEDTFTFLDPNNAFRKNKTPGTNSKNPKSSKPVILIEYDVSQEPLVEEYIPGEETGLSRNEYTVSKRIDGSCVSIFYKSDKVKNKTDYDLPLLLDTLYTEDIDFEIIENDEKYKIKKLIVYKYKGKFGAFLSDKYFLSPKYDSIRLLVLGKKSPEYFFQVGIKDSITKKMKFGIVSLKGNIEFQITFDVIRNPVDNQFGEKKNNFILTLDETDTEFIVAYNGKYGIFSLYGERTQKVPLFYDDIFYLDSKTYILVKSNLYGIYFQDNHTVRKKILEPVFTKIPFKNNLKSELPIIELYDVYYSANEYNDFHKTDILKRTGNFFCYGNINGMMYYKEK